MNDFSEIEKLTHGWGKRHWREETIRYIQAEGLADRLNAKVESSFREKVRDAVSDGQFEIARDWAFLGIVLSNGRMALDTKVIEQFVPTKQARKHAKGLMYLLRRLVADCKSVGIDDACFSRLQNLATYSELWYEVGQDQSKLFAAMNSDRREVYVSLLMIAEAGFSGVLPLATLGTRWLAVESVSHLSREELASAVSYLIGVTGRVTPLKDSDFSALNDTNGFVDLGPLIVLAYKLHRVHELAADIVRADYKIERREDGAFEVSPVSERMGMALSFGYLKTQLLDRFPDEFIKGAMSFFDMCKEWFKVCGEEMVPLVPGPPKRIVVKIPEIVLKKMAKDIFLKDTFFREEMYVLYNVSYELFANLSHMRDFELKPGCSLLDFLKVWRSYCFLASIRALRLDQLNKENPEYWNSLLIGINRKEIVRQFETIGYSNSQIEGFLSVVSWDAHGDEFLDLQYTPFLLINELVIIPLHLFVTSNVIRNALITEQVRIFSDGKIDPLSDLIEAPLKKRISRTKSNIKYEVNGERGQIDVLALAGNTLFVFECKNMILPCSAHERRTLLDYLDKASDQLDRFNRNFKKGGLIEILESKTGWKIPKDVKLETCIVLSHRLYSGAQYRGHSIRHGHELRNLLETGKVEAGVTGHSVHKFSLWQQSEFSSNDLVRYLDENAEPYASVWKAMHHNLIEFGFEKTRLFVSDFGVDLVSYLKNVGAPKEIIAEAERKLIEVESGNGS